MPGKRAFGTKFAYETTTPGTFTDIANITNIKPYNLKVDIVDTTSHDSPSNYREKEAGAIDAGQCVLELNYDPAAATHTWLHTECAAAASHKYKVTWPGGSKTATFSGLIVGVGPESPYDGKLTCSVTIEITGAVTIA
jgi:predicted secreted protein